MGEKVNGDLHPEESLLQRLGERQAKSGEVGTYALTNPLKMYDACGTRLVAGLMTVTCRTELRTGAQSPVRMKQKYVTGQHKFLSTIWNIHREN